eukprot:250981_1
MSLFDFIFFECGHYQIANYVNKYYKTKSQVFEMIIGTDFFIKDHDWMQSVDRSNKLCSKYQPRMCKMRIVYEYDDDDKITREFGTKQGKPMLINPNLMLQYIDQRKLCNGNTQKSLVVKINTDIKYQYRFHNGD